MPTDQHESVFSRCLILVIVLASALASIPAFAQSFTSFDPPGSNYTTPSSINSAGAITGNYFDALTNLGHGFVRWPDGSFTTFDPPGAGYTEPHSMNSAGAIAGFYEYADGQQHGFLRAPDGNFTSFDPPGSSGTSPSSINLIGTITGFYYDAGLNQHGFLRWADGTFTTFDPPGSTYTQPNSINPGGAVTGFYYDSDGNQRGFLRRADGTFTTFDPMGTYGTQPSSINPAGTITGFYYDFNYQQHGFLRAPDGTITTFDPIVSNYTAPNSINPTGAITGNYNDPVTNQVHGFVRAPGGGITTFDPPGSTYYTQPNSINHAGTITGFYDDVSGNQHGFVGAPIATTVVATNAGPLTGIEMPTMNEYLGIPYAAPPVGNRRWMPPARSAKWQGIFQAAQLANECPQYQYQTYGGNIVGSEDCLYLNVYVPNGPPPKGGFPVMVWIHGGAMLYGAGSSYDPSAIVENGNVIVVTINYRLGLLGFFAQQAIDAEGHTNGNYGLMDQQAALKWVQRNIKGFSGNPGKVTIFGESAGGFSVFSNLASPTAAGLFQGAITQSGGYFQFQDYFNTGIDASVVPLTTAESTSTPWVPAGATLATNMGCASADSANLLQQAQCLRALDAPTVFSAFPAFGVLFPFIDGTVLTQTPAAAIAQGSFNHVPVMAGTNHDEGTLDILLEYDYGPLGRLWDGSYTDAVSAYVYPPNPQFVDYLVGTEYPLGNYINPVSWGPRAPMALSALETDNQFVCPTRNAEGLLAPQVPTYVYEFNDPTAPLWFTPPWWYPISFPMGDSHFIEVQYLFPNQGLGLSGDELTLSDTMIGYWTQFAKTGNPNAAHAPVWPKYSVGGSLESLIAPTPTTETDASFDADHKCSSFWNKLTF